MKNIAVLTITLVAFLAIIAMQTNAEDKKETKVSEKKEIKISGKKINPKNVPPLPGNVPNKAKATEMLSFLPKIVAEVGEEKITDKDIIKALTPQLLQVQMSGQKINQDKIKDMATGFIDGLIQRTILTNLAKKEDVKPDMKQAEEYLEQTIQRMGGEQGFKQMLTMTGKTKKELLDELSMDMAIQKWIQEGIASKIEVTDDQAEVFYNENKKDFSSSSEIKTSHILLKLEEDADDKKKDETKKKISDLLKELKDGADFAELAKKNSDCPSSSKGGDLGFFGKGRMVPAFEEAAWSLKVGEISDVVKTRFGYHIIKLTDRKEGGTQKLEEVSEKIKNYLKQKALSEKVLAMIKDAEKKIGVKRYLEKK